ncbi:MAG: hypothetical protein ONB48_05990 [candidate division KSB1 bacterium]|nr:hypothetical protein [candidate division KSB1 bacterium]MDZ7273098.1 hypothetical protein [candidate division KSB1 bacterium]MDZ7285200.1 hypothetical protein [candidate division KSB1 bacterium]MDZ7298232.1 hypothetical protein [candidate division KSB1 bacterium]MDZ7306734.1 hypothetical protein [candidate division KSB1 bacterium]
MDDHAEQRLFADKTGQSLADFLAQFGIVNSRVQRGFQNRHTDVIHARGTFQRGINVQQAVVAFCQPLREAGNGSLAKTIFPL